MRLLSGILGVFLALSAHAGTMEVAQFCGIDDTDVGNIIPDCNAKSALNVEANLGSTAISKRQGYTQIAGLSIATSPVNGSVYFRDTAGNDIVVVCYGQTCAASKNGAAFVVFMTTASSAAAQYSFATWNGSVYAADNAHDAIWRYDGTTISSTSLPACSILSLDQDRMICANTVAAPNSVNFSKSGDYSIWVTGVNSPDPFVDFVGTPGDQVTGISYWLGVLYIFKQYSIMACSPGDQYTTSCTQLNTFTGTGDGNSIVQAPDGLYFKGTDGNFWKYDGYNFSIISLKIQNTIKTFSSGSTGFNIQTGAVSWAAGTQTPLRTFDFTTISGSVFPSSVTFSLLGLNPIDWSMISVDTTVAGSSLTVSNNDGVVLDSIWTTRDGSVVNSNHSITGATAGPDSISVVNKVSTGVWSYVFLSTATGSPSTDFWFVASDTKTTGGGTDFGNSYLLQILQGQGANNLLLFKRTASAATQLANSAGPAGNYYDGVARTFLITRTLAGFMTLYINGVFVFSATDATIASTNFINIRFAGSINTEHYSSVKFPQFYTNSVSTPYFTNLSTAGTLIQSQFVANESSSTAAPVIFNGLFSTATLGPYSTFFLETPGNYWQVASSSMPYFRYNITPGAPTNASSASVTSLFIAEATTGTYVTQCIQLPSTISGFGTLNCNTTTSGTGSLTFFSTSAATCAGLATGTMTAAGQWTATTNGGNIAVSTNATFALRFDTLLKSATDQAQVNACTINFKVGTLPPPVWGIYTPVNNAIYWSGDVNNSTVTNRTFKYDLNNSGWFPFDLPVQAPLVYRNSLYFGSGLGGYWNLYANGVNNDNGMAISSSWVSKDWNLGEAFQEKSLMSVSLVAVNQGSGNLTVTQAADGSNSSSFTVSIGTAATTSYIRGNYRAPVQSPYTFYNVQFANNAANNPWSILGYRMDFTLMPWRALGPP